MIAGTLGINLVTPDRYLMGVSPVFFDSYPSSKSLLFHILYDCGSPQQEKRQTDQRTKEKKNETKVWKHEYRIIHCITVQKIGNLIWNVFSLKNILYLITVSFILITPETLRLKLNVLWVEVMPANSSSAARPHYCQHDTELLHTRKITHTETGGIYYLVGAEGVASDCKITEVLFLQLRYRLGAN